MNCCIPGSLYTCWNTFKNDVRVEVYKIPRNLGQIDQILGSTLGVVSYGLMPVALALKTAGEKTARFVKDNWRQLIGYILAWAVIVTCTGLLYGFQGVALPLTIGLGCGIAFGIIAGILSVKSYDTNGKYTLWNLLNQGIQGLDENGTRQIVSTVAVTVILAASVVFPYVMGGLFGLLIALQMTVKIATDQDLGRDPTKEKQSLVKLQQDFAHLQTAYMELNGRFEVLEGREKLQQDYEKLQELNQKFKERLDAFNATQPDTPINVLD
jgi:hypothetical protein